MEHQIKKLSESIFPLLQEIRRSLHRHPEIAFEEYKTGDILCSYLEKWNIPYQRGIAKTGIVAMIQGEHPGKTVALRADMDALPIQEETGLPFASENPGMMHACGHDSHMTMVLGAAYILSQLRSFLHGNVKLFFQPAEEGVGGAKPMIEAGCMENPTVSACFAAHVSEEYDIGKVYIKDGAIMASPDEFDLVIRGRGGHGGLPHQTVDPIAIAGVLIGALQTIPSRMVPPAVPCALSLCAIHAGNNYNIIPDTVKIQGTARTTDPELRRAFPDLIEGVVKGVTSAYGADYTFDFRMMYPPVINSAPLNRLFENSAREVLGEGSVIWGDEPSMWGEDFAYFSQEVPGAYIKLGIRNPAVGAVYSVHNAKFTIDETVLKYGAAIFAKTALDYLKQQSSDAEKMK